MGTHAAFCLLPAAQQDMHATPFRVSCSGEEDVLKCENAQSHTHIQFNVTSSGNVASHRKHKNAHTRQNAENRWHCTTCLSSISKEGRLFILFLFFISECWSQTDRHRKRKAQRRVESVQMVKKKGFKTVPFALPAFKQVTQFLSLQARNTLQLRVALPRLQ